MAGWVNGFTSAATVTVIVVAIAMGAIIEHAILSELANDEPEGPQGDGELTQSAPPAGQRSSSTEPAQPAPAPATSLTRQVEQLTLRERGSQARKTYQARSTGRPVVRFTRINEERNSALGTSVIPMPRSSSAMPEATLFVGQKSADRWRVALAGTREFQELLQKIPTSLVPSGEKQLLAEFSDGTIKRRQAETGLMLPWRPGESWTLQAEAGDDGNSGPPNFLGFSRGDGKVLAAGGGRLYRLCASKSGSGLVMVIHPNGLATQYYQMSKVTTRRDGSIIQRGDYVGTVGTERPCGGVAADTPQVWFGVRDATSVISLNNKEVGGWRFAESKSAPGITAVRGLSRIIAGRSLRNLESGLSSVLPLPGRGTDESSPSGEQSPDPQDPTPGTPSPVSLPPVSYDAPKA